MKKREAIELWVAREMQAVPLEWVQTVAEAKGKEIYVWPMWGTMFILNHYEGETLIELAEVEGCQTHDEYTEDCAECDSQDEEMRGALRIPDTAAYIYEIDGEYVLGIHGAGWNFYDGLWDELYDRVGLQWHR